MAEDRLQQALELSKQGKRQEAAGVLMGIVQTDKENIRAWAALADVVDSKEQKIDCLQRVIKGADDLEMINWATNKLATLTSGSSEAPPPSSPEPEPIIEATPQPEPEPAPAWEPEPAPSFDADPWPEDAQDPDPQTPEEVGTDAENDVLRDLDQLDKGMKKGNGFVAIFTIIIIALIAGVALVALGIVDLPADLPVDIPGSTGSDAPDLILIESGTYQVTATSLGGNEVAGWVDAYGDPNQIDGASGVGPLGAFLAGSHVTLSRAEGTTACLVSGTDNNGKALEGWIPCARLTPIQ